MKAIKDMTTAEMLCEYNVLTGKSIKKFASRAAGEKQLAAARAAEEAAKKPPVQFPSKKEEAPPAKQPPKEKPKKTPAVKVARGEAVAASWQDTKVRAARSARSRVVVDGVEFRSVAAAFHELGLPMNKHIKFRATLKATGKESFQHEGEVHNFVLAPLSE